MGKKKQTSTTQNTYGYAPAAPANPYYTNAASLINDIDSTTPIKQQYGQLRTAINESGNEFYGANTTPEVRDRVKSGRLFNAMTSEGRDLMAATQNDNAAKIAGNMGLGGATAPPLVQLGGSSQGASWGSGLYSPLGELGMNAAQSAVM